MPLDLQPTLENELVILRPLKESDYSSLYAVASDPLIWSQHPSPDRYKEENFKEFFRDAIHSKGAFISIDKATKQVIGSTRFRMSNSVGNAVEIGWTFLSRSYWGGQYNGSIKRLMISHAFESLDEVVFRIGKDNIRSQKAVEKIGGKRLENDEFRKYYEEDPERVAYIIRKEEWV
ncbi:MAG: N-acetyltransferase [Bacteroidetes bacterium]|nr:MAG: N-acetyltransferase [Bacteroidota bacterium]